LAILEQNSPLAVFFRPFLTFKEIMKFADYLDPRLVAFLESSTQEEALEELIELLDEEGKLPSRKAFQAAILQREQIVSTGIGMGVAVPHAKLSTLKGFFIAIGIQRKKGIEWNALDKAPVRLVFLIGGPDHKQSEYLQILSQLTTAIRDVELRKSLLKARTPEEAITLFTSRLG
jgi:PTS system nitrogen regulatory IIA component